MADQVGIKVAKHIKITDENETLTVGLTTDSRLEAENYLIGDDNLAVSRRAQVIVRTDGIKALAVDSRTVVESTFGFDQQPDSFYRIIDTGGAGTTWTVFVEATSVDPSSPDRDVPSFTKVFTVVAGEVGDEIKLRDRMITELNASSAFKDDSLLKAEKATDRAIVHIFSTALSTTGEFYERPLGGDFDVTIGGAPGDGVVIIGFDNFISRSKPVTISKDFDSPHALGQFGVVGDVNISFKDLDDLFFQFATDDGTPIVEAGGTGDENMLVDGSVTPVDFNVPAQADTDIFINAMIFRGQGNGIKLNQFFSKAGAGGLTNGVVVTIKSDNIVTTFLPLHTTADFKNRWAALSGSLASWDLAVEASADEGVAVLAFQNPFIIKVAGAFGAGNDDFIRVTIADDLTSGVAFFDFIVRGFEKEP